MSASTAGSEYGRCPKSSAASGFTLLEVLVALTVMAVGAAITLSLISGSLGNIRKVQMRTKAIEHAEAVMELALLDKSISQPTAYSGTFEDGSRWSVSIDAYDPPLPPQPPSQQALQFFRVKLLRYTVEMFNPDSKAPDFRLHTLKLVPNRPQTRLMEPPQ